MNTNSGSFRVFETICGELIGRLKGDTSQRATMFAAEARELLDRLGRTASEAPTPEERSLMIARVLGVHRMAMDYLVQRDGKSSARGA